jgi:hypothetical protein
LGNPCESVRGGRWEGPKGPKGPPPTQSEVAGMSLLWPPQAGSRVACSVFRLRVVRAKLCVGGALSAEICPCAVSRLVSRLVSQMVPRLISPPTSLSPGGWSYVLCQITSLTKGRLFRSLFVSASTGRSCWLPHAQKIVHEKVHIAMRINNQAHKRNQNKQKPPLGNVGMH